MNMVGPSSCSRYGHTQAILKKALAKLTEFYKKSLFLQKAKQEPPVN